MPFWMIFACYVAALLLWSCYDWLRERRQIRKSLDYILLLYELSLPPHKHKCPRNDCGTVWQHTTKEGMRPGAHSCPRCGTAQYVKYFPKAA